MTALLSLFVVGVVVAAVTVRAVASRQTGRSAASSTRTSAGANGARSATGGGSSGGASGNGASRSGSSTHPGQTTSGSGAGSSSHGATTAPGAGTGPGARQTANTPVWRVAWGSAMAWAQPGVTIDNTTVRELATIPIGGSAVRVRISNLFGNAPLEIGQVTVGRSVGNANVAAGSIRTVRFSGATSAVIPVGGVLTSDPVRFAARHGETLAVSIYVIAPDLVTVHPYGNHGPVSFATYNGTPDETVQASGAPFVYWSVWPRLLDAVDVLTRLHAGSIVALGDSITDGFNATTSWTDVLQQRIDLLPRADRAAVINEGITANTLDPMSDNYSKTGGGPAGLTRLRQDVLSLPGVSTVIVLLGTNDLYFGATAAQVINGLRRLAAIAHRAGLRVIGVPLLPREGSQRWQPTLYPLHQPYLEQINHWIRTSHTFNAVLNFPQAVADVYNGQCNPNELFGPYNSGDFLHPNAAGQTAMANSIDTRLLGLAPAPRVAPLVAVQPTPGCRA